jgi:hypothetical protein
MAVRLPTLEQIDNLGSDLGLVLTADEVTAFQQAFKGPLASYGRLDELVPPALAPIAPRSPGYRLSESENPYGAWYGKTNIHVGGEGLLSCKKIAIKDNICVAGVPMMNGSALLEDYVPELDVTVVTNLNGNLQGTRIGIDRRWTSEGVDAAAAKVFQDALRIATDFGAEIHSRRRSVPARHRMAPPPSHALTI